MLLNPMANSHPSFDLTLQQHLALSSMKNPFHLASKTPETPDLSPALPATPSQSSQLAPFISTAPHSTIEGQLGLEPSLSIL